VKKKVAVNLEMLKNHHCKVEVDMHFHISYAIYIKSSPTRPASINNVKGNVKGTGLSTNF